MEETFRAGEMFRAGERPWAGERPRVSVLVPAYNAGGTLERLVRSLQGQSVSAWEAVIVDDNSADDTLEVARRLAEAEPRVRVFAMPCAPLEEQGMECEGEDTASGDYSTERHGGTPFLTRREAASHARGRYVCCIDADDYVEPEFLAKLLARAEETGAAMTLCTLNAGDADDLEGKRVFPAADVDMTTVAPGRELINWTLYEWRVPLIGALIEREIFAAVCGEEHRAISNPYYDELASRKTLMRAGRVALSEAVYHEVKHAGSLTSTVSPRSFDNLDILPEIDSLIREEYGEESAEHDRAALHSFAVWIDAQRTLRRVRGASNDTIKGAKGTKGLIDRAEVQRRVDATALSLPMARLRRLLSPRYLAIVEWHRLVARLRRASRRR